MRLVRGGAMTRGQGTQQFPAGARTKLGRCSAPLHDGRRAPIEVVPMRLGFPDTGPVSADPIERMVCAECLADFAIVDVGGMCAFALAGDGMWHQVKGELP